MHLIGYGIFFGRKFDNNLGFKKKLGGLLSPRPILYRVSLKTCFFEKNVKNRVFKNTIFFSISGIFMIITRRLVHISNKYSDYVSSYWCLKTNNFTPIFYFWIFWGFCALFLFIYNFSLVHPCPNRQLGTFIQKKVNWHFVVF